MAWKTMKADFLVKAGRRGFRVTWQFTSSGLPTEVLVYDFDGGESSVDNRDGRYCPCPTCAYMLAKQQLNGSKSAPGQSIRLSKIPTGEA